MPPSPLPGSPWGPSLAWCPLSLPFPERVRPAHHSRHPPGLLPLRALVHSVDDREKMRQNFTLPRWLSQML